MRMNVNVTRTIRWAAVVCVAAFVAMGCSRTPKDDASTKQKAVAFEAVEGMKYYVGGPVMKYDKYERLRLAGFNGEISSPTTRGLLLGFKTNEDRTFDYRTWLNGEIISESSGFLDGDGLLWYSERVSYDANGEVVVRQKFTYDEKREIMTSIVDHIDPVDQKVVKTESQEIPYTPTPEEVAEGDEAVDESEDAAPAE
jgi:hypothetical protein